MLRIFPLEKKKCKFFAINSDIQQNLMNVEAASREGIDKRRRMTRVSKEDTRSRKRTLREK
jgi:hypothetical protein